MAKYDLVLKGGTVLDPANGFEAVSDVGISAGLIDRVEPELDPAEADDLIDVTGKWVMPGQIDTHAHVAGISENWDPALGYAMLARAGTTTLLDLAGTGPNLIDGIKRRGAGLNVAGLFVMAPGATIDDEDPSPSALSDIVTDAMRQGCIGVKLIGGYQPLLPRRLRMSSRPVTVVWRTSPFTSAPRNRGAISAVCGRYPSWSATGVFTWPTSTPTAGGL